MVAQNVAAGIKIRSDDRHTRLSQLRRRRFRVLFLILTSHGSRAGLAVKAGRLTQLLTPLNLADMLALTRVRHKVVVISACYFIPRLANPNVLVITAADADHSSFGCRDKGKWTYFGDAFFNIALRQAFHQKKNTQSAPCQSHVSPAPRFPLPRKELHPSFLEMQLPCG
jgi:hypothetical protein